MNRKDRRAAAASSKKGGSAIAPEAYDAYVLGYNCHSRGDYEGAKANYLRAAKSAPNHSGVLLGLGLLSMKDGLLDDAERLLRKAHLSEPRDANILVNLAAALLTSKKFADCIETSKMALAMQPGNVDALVNLCHAQRELKDFDGAVLTGERAVKANPENGLALRAYALALVMKPENVWTRFTEILGYLRKARDIDGADGSLDLILADFLQERGEYSEVIEILRGGTPNLDDPNYCRIAAQAFFGMQDYHTALKFAKRRCELEPQSAKAHERLSKVLSNLQHHEESLKTLLKCIELDPNEHPALLDICQMRQQLCDWDGLEAMQIDVVEKMRFHRNFSGPFHLISMPEPAGSPENQLLAAQLYQERMELTGITSKARHPRKRTNERLKIGYLSNDYRDHATAYLIAELIERHDRRDFEISAYCYTQNDNSVFQNRLRTAFDRFVDINALSLEEAAKKIEADGIDILVDLKGFTQGSRTSILAYRPAPISANFLGFPGTSGADFVDYIIGDEFLTPLSSADYYAEKIVQLPHCYQPNDTTRVLPDTLLRRRDFGLPESAFVFASFNNNNKLTPAVFDIWMRLLARIPGSVFWILALTPVVKTNLRKEAVKRGIDPDRLIFAERVNVTDHIARLKLADLFLDCFPCTAHTTASEALWGGLPLLTCAGRTFSSRVAGSILTAANLPELVTESLEQYEALALELANDPARLKALRSRASNAASTPMFDIAMYTRDLERAYIRMAEIYNSGESPQAITVRELSQREATSPPSIQDRPPMAAPAVASQSAVADSLADARIDYTGCPLCYSSDCAPLGSSDCTNHQLYKSNLPATIDWLACQSCHHVFASGFFGEEALASIYEKTPASELAGFDIERKRLSASKIVQRVARMAKGGTWLDVGFGDASLIFAAEEWGYKAVGLDIREDNVRALSDFGYEAHNLCIELYEPEDKCSVISMVNLLQHLPFPGSAVASASKLLQPGGLLLLTMPNMDSVVWRAMDRERMNPYWSDLEIYHHFTRKRLYDLLIVNGLLPLEYSVSEHHRSSMDVLAIKPGE